MSSPRTMWSIFSDRRRRSSGEGQGLRSFLTFCLRGPDTAPTAYPAAKKPVPSLLGCCTAACYFRAFDQTQDWVRFANQLAVWVWAMAARGLLLCLPQDGAVPGKTMRTWTLAAVLFLGVLVSIDLEAIWMAAPQSATTLASASSAWTSRLSTISSRLRSRVAFASNLEAKAACCSARLRATSST